MVRAASFAAALALGLRGGNVFFETYPPPGQDPQQQRRPAEAGGVRSSSSNSGGTEVVVTSSPSQVEARSLPPDPIPSPFPYTFYTPLVGRKNVLMHCKAIVTSLLYASWAFGLVFHGKWAFMSALRSKDDDGSAMSLFTISFILPPLLYFWEALRSSTLSYVRDREDARSVDRFIETGLRHAPRVTFFSESFHYTYDRRNKKQEKRVTSRDYGWYAMGGWSDASSAAAEKRAAEAELLGDHSCSALVPPSSGVRFWKRGSASTLKKQWRLPGLPLVKIRVETALKFRDSEAAEDYCRQLGHFRARHAYKDTHQSVDAQLDILDVDEAGLNGDPSEKTTQLCGFPSWRVSKKRSRARRFLAVKDSMDSFVSPLASPGAFWLATCLGLTVPYRFWLDSKCGVATLTFVKEVFAPPRREAFLHQEEKVHHQAAFQDFQQWQQEQQQEKEGEEEDPPQNTGADGLS